jgi:uncharacterized membrane protein YjfL (UPF0719 family)
MILQLRRALAVGGGMAWLVLSIVVLASHPSNQFDLMAWGDIAGAVGLLALAIL